MSIAIEGVIKSSHLNITKNVPNAVGSQMAMQSSIFGRLGMPLGKNQIDLAKTLMLGRC